MATAAALRPSGPRRAVSAAGLPWAARSRITDTRNLDMSLYDTIILFDRIVFDPMVGDTGKPFETKRTVFAALRAAVRAR
jgi:hypothetical protein